MGPSSREHPLSGLLHLAVELSGRFPALISVVIPVLNAADTLPAQLEALSGQTYEGKWELIIADNGSTDGTVEIARSWGDRIQGLRAVDASDRKGQAHARNVGAAAAHGDFIAFCDADDVATPGWLEGMAEAARSCDVAAGTLDHDSLNPRSVRSWRSAQPREEAPADEAFLPWAESANLGVRASVFRKLGGFNETYQASEDVEFSWRVQLASYTLASAPDAVVRYRHRSSVRSLMRQHYVYGVNSARLYRDFRNRGMRRPPLRRALRVWSRVIPHLVMNLTSPGRRGVWLRKAAYRWGRIRGSIRYRVFYP
jgi:glycosyltransferase involved in cell wall biosynthesis